MGKEHLREYVLKLEIPFTVYAKTGVESCMCEAEKVLSRSDWDEGRHGFARELIAHGLKDELERCAMESALALMEVKYGRNHVTEHDTEWGRSTSNTAYMKAHEWLKEDFGGAFLKLDRMKGTVEGPIREEEDS